MGKGDELTLAGTENDRDLKVGTERSAAVTEGADEPQLGMPLLVNLERSPNRGVGGLGVGGLQEATKDQ
jgi:hypothetical protein